MIDWIIWVAAGLGLLILEMLLPGVFMMWLGLAACGAGLLTLAFEFGFSGQVVSFGILAAITLSIGLRVRRPGTIMRTERAGLIARGRDAADVAISTTFGPNVLRRFIVHTEEVVEEPARLERRDRKVA